MFRRIVSTFHLSDTFYPKFQRRAKIRNTLAAFCSQKNSSQGRCNLQAIRDKGFLAFYIFYGLHCIDPKKLLRQNNQFITIGDKILEQKQKIKYHQDSEINEDIQQENQNENASKSSIKVQEGNKNNQKFYKNILRVNSDQFFSAFQIGKGIRLPTQVFDKQRIAIAGDKQERIVFNVNSVTQKMFKFSLDDQRVLLGNYGIGKTWSHALINYLSIHMWNYFKQFKTLKEIQKLVDLNLDIFIEIHQKYGERIIVKKYTSSIIMQRLQRFPFLLFIELKTDLTWIDFVKSLHMQCPQIQKSNRQMTIKKQDQSEEQFKRRTFRNDASWAKKFLNNIWDLLPKYNYINFFLLIDQANIYFKNLRQALFTSKIKRSLNPSQLLSSDQKKKWQEQYYKKIEQQTLALSNILQIIHNSKMETKIKFNCSGVNHLSKMALFKQYIPLYFNMFRHQGYDLDQIKQGIKIGSNVGQKQMWAIFWFQIQRNIFKNINLSNQDQIRSFKSVLKSLKLRQFFNSMFYEIDAGHGKRKHRWLLTVNFQSFRKSFQQKIVDDELKILLAFIAKVNDQFKQIAWNKMQNNANKQKETGVKRLEQQLNQFWNNNKQAAQGSIKSFVQVLFKQVYLECTKQTKLNSTKWYFQNNKFDLQNKKKIFLLKLKNVLKMKQQNDKNLINLQQFRFNPEDVQQLLSQLLIYFQPVSNSNIDNKITNSSDRIKIETILNNLINPQYMQITTNQNNKIELLIKQPAAKLKKRIQQIQVDQKLKDDYVSWLKIRDQYKIYEALQFDRHMAFLISSSENIFTIGEYKFNIVNKELQTYLDFIVDMPQEYQTIGIDNCKAKQQKKSKQEQQINILRQQMQSKCIKNIITALQKIKQGQTLGLRPITDKNVNSSSIRYFDLILVQKAQGSQNQLLNRSQENKVNNSNINKHQIFTIKFSFQKEYQYQANEAKDLINQKFYYNYIENNQKFLQKFEYKHIIIGLNQACKYHQRYIKRRGYDDISKKSFIKVVPYKNVKFEQRKIASEQRLMAEIWLELLQNSNYDGELI